MLMAIDLLMKLIIIIDDGKYFDNDVRNRDDTYTGVKRLPPIISFNYFEPRPLNCSWKLLVNVNYVDAKDIKDMIVW